MFTVRRQTLGLFAAAIPSGDSLPLWRMSDWFRGVPAENVDCGRSLRAETSRSEGGRKKGRKEEREGKEGRKRGEEEREGMEERKGRIMDKYNWHMGDEKWRIKRTP